LNTTFSTYIYQSTKNLPDLWDAVVFDNVFLSKKYLSVLEESCPENMKCVFVTLCENEKMIGAAVFQLISISNLQSFGVNKSCLKAKFRDFVFKNFANHILFLGNNMLTGQNAYFLPTHFSNNEVGFFLNKAVTDVENFYKKSNTKIHLKVIKDLGVETTTGLKPMFDEYFQFEIQPNMVFDIKSDWNSEADYVASFVKKYRDQYKRARKKASGIEKRKFSLDEIVFFEKKINSLYFNVTKNAPFNTFYLEKSHFASLKKHLKHNFLFYAYFLDNEMIGFNTLIKNNQTIETYFLGYDDDFQRDKMLYLNMLYDMIAFSINKGFDKIIFARTALEIKSSVGAQPLKMFGFIKHSNKIINYILPKIFKYFEPEASWTQRNPFK
jgi:Acetyltransferase (GNAT) domain